VLEEGGVLRSQDCLCSWWRRWWWWWPKDVDGGACGEWCVVRNVVRVTAVVGWYWRYLLVFEMELEGISTPGDSKGKTSKCEKKD